MPGDIKEAKQKEKEKEEKEENTEKEKEKANMVEYPYVIGTQAIDYIVPNADVVKEKNSEKETNGTVDKTDIIDMEEKVNEDLKEIVKDIANKVEEEEIKQTEKADVVENMDNDGVDKVENIEVTVEKMENDVTKVSEKCVTDLYCNEVLDDKP